MGKINLDAASVRIGSSYPAPYDQPCKERKRVRLGDAVGLTQFGVNLLRLPPGAWSSQRHWHSVEDEFVWVLEGEVVLVTNEGETVLRAGDCAGFPGGVANGHHLQNRSAQEVVLLEVGSRRPNEDACDYPDLDMVIAPGVGFCYRDGRPYPKDK
ncbi:MAG TPA: cupin domain-containing protein [Steroidobacteraceae bacterium]|nr:cupin domain-containing protein [Steroidobacteraceae bacterium]